MISIFKMQFLISTLKQPIRSRTHSRGPGTDLGPGSKIPLPSEQVHLADAADIPVFAQKPRHPVSSNIDST